jgi:nicotinate (nicotinamide) nucleotide adenylyltransferase
LLPLELIQERAPVSQRVVLFPGTWNPPTIAHLEIARAALADADEVIWVLPRAFPHKDFEGADFESRKRMIERIVHDTPGFSAAISTGGLYAEIAREARELLGSRADISLAMGRDAAERIANWDYGRPGFFDDFVREYKLLVAARSGDYSPARNHAGRITALQMGRTWDDVSSTEVRRRILEGGEWKHLVPAAIHDMVQILY